MVRELGGVCWLALVLVVSGCTSSGSGSSWHWPWQNATASQELSVPPEGDPRFSNPPSYPRSSTAKPELKRDDGNSRMPATGLGPRSPSSAGNFMR